MTRCCSQCGREYTPESYEHALDRAAEERERHIVACWVVGLTVLSVLATVAVAVLTVMR